VISIEIYKAFANFE